MKRILSVMLAVVMFSGILSAFSLPAAADNSNSKVRRVISVVYDDSGSMFKEKAARWANANYAMQSFCSMLNSEDELYITYMSDPNNAREIDLSNVESEIENIRYHDKAGNTPFKSVETAYNKLASLDGDFYDDDTTQYWLVIISDGTFNSDDGVTADNIN